MTTSNKSAGGGTPSGSEVQTGSPGSASLHEVPRAVPAQPCPALDRYQYDGLEQIIAQFNGVRVLAEASAAWVEVYRGVALNSHEVERLFALIAEQALDSTRNLECYQAELQGKLAAMAGAAQ